MFGVPSQRALRPFFALLCHLFVLLTQVRGNQSSSSWWIVSAFGGVSCLLVIVEIRNRCPKSYEFEVLSIYVSLRDDVFFTEVPAPKYHES